MTKKWFPERDSMDSSIALLKNFIYYTFIPISKLSIEKEVKEHKDYPSLTLSGIQEILAKWGLMSVTYLSENMNEIPCPSILYVNDLNRSEVVTEFVILFKAENNKVEYLHTRKGWVIETKSEFTAKWEKVTLSLTSIELPRGEMDFQKKEDLYEKNRVSMPGFKNVLVKDNFLTDFECEYIIQLSHTYFKRSSVINYGDSELESETRTSFSAYLVFPDDEILKNIKERVSKLLNIPTSHFESFQCVSYKEKQEFESHYDSFDESTSFGKKIVEESGQRKYTVLAYLNDDFVGGGTHFPVLDLLIEPKKRTVVLFKNIYENGNVVKSSIHAGLPVTSGRKYALNIWVRNKPISN